MYGGYNIYIYIYTIITSVVGRDKTLSFVARIDTECDRTSCVTSV